MSGPGRHPLLDEAKSELDIVFEAVREAERLTSAPALRGGGTAELFELYEMQADAIERFRLVSALFAAASAADFPEEMANRFVEILPVFSSAAVDGATEFADFARALDAYLNGRSVERQDGAVRRAAAAIEAEVRRGPAGASGAVSIAASIGAE